MAFQNRVFLPTLRLGYRLLPTLRLGHLEAMARPVARTFNSFCPIFWSYFILCTCFAFSNVSILIVYLTILFIKVLNTKKSYFISFTNSWKIDCAFGLSFIKTRSNSLVTCIFPCSSFILVISCFRTIFSRTIFSIMSL